MKKKTKNEYKFDYEYFDFFEKNVNPILKELKHAILRDQPEDVATFSYEWLTRFHKGDINHRSHPDAGNDASGPILNTKNASKPIVKDHLSHSTVSDTSEDNDSIMSDSAFQKLRQRRQEKNQRKGVSAEVYGRHNKKQDFIPVKIMKDSQQEKRIYERINENLLFKNLSDDEKQVIVDAMVEVQAIQGDYIIKQGDNGNEFYIVDSGQLDCFKEFKGKRPKYLKTYFQGEGFGELSLLYNAPRAASIVAKSDSVLYMLDRGTFNHIVLESTIKKRKRYEDLIKKIKILDSLDPYEQQLLIDAFQEIKFKKGEYVIKEGQDGDTFFFVEKGEAVALKKNRKTGKKEQVYRYKRGGFFGEIALLKEVKRQASIKAVTDLVLMSVDKKSFNRILGPLEVILQRNMKRYDKFVKGKEVGEDTVSSSDGDSDEESY